MSVLTVTNVPDEVVAELQRRAATHGLSVEEEAREVLRELVPGPVKKFTPEENRKFAEFLLTFPDVGEDWMFDRNDPRNASPARARFTFEA